MAPEVNIQGETCSVVKDLYNRVQHLHKDILYEDHYKDYAEFLTDECMKEIAHSRTGKQVLLYVEYMLSIWFGRLLFYERILRNRQEFDDSFIALVWYKLYSCHGDILNPRVEEADGSVSVFYFKDFDQEKVSKSILTSPLLLSSPNVNRWYCFVHKKGWETLRYIDDGRTWSELYTLGNICDRIEQDDIPGFEICRCMRAESVDFPLISAVLYRKAWKIFHYLLDNYMDEIEAAFPLEEIACFAVSSLPDEDAVHTLMILEKCKPGLVNGFSDALGQNLLWYGMYNLSTCWFYPNIPLTTYLLDHGCNPNQLTNIGLSWQFLTDSLSGKDKWERCYSWQRNNFPLQRKYKNLWWDYLK